MVELKYPYPDTSTQKGEEDFPVIDVQGNVIGRASRRYCHSGTMALHPVVHLHIFDHVGNLYLQKRSMTKDIAPGRWDTAVGGHVDYGENIMEALNREAGEELGIMINNLTPKPLFDYVWKSSRECEIVNAFAIRYEGKITPDLKEVDEGRFWSLEEIHASLGKEIFTQQFEQEEIKRIFKYLDKYEI